jgi:hypothetical protein
MPLNPLVTDYGCFHETAPLEKYPLSVPDCYDDATTEIRRALLLLSTVRLSHNDTWAAAPQLSSARPVSLLLAGREVQAESVTKNRNAVKLDARSLGLG